MEAIVKSPKCVCKTEQQPPPPPLVVLSLSIQTALNKSHQHEVYLGGFFSKYNSKLMVQPMFRPVDLDGVWYGQQASRDGR
jgi:hypothetical protein